MSEFGISSKLRTRITKVLGRHLASDRFCLGDMVDAVIRELKLEQEWGCPTNNCRCSHRYTTEWKLNDE